MSGSIASNQATAGAAVTKLSGVSVVNEGKIDVPTSTIESIVDGTQVNNEMISTLSDLVEYVQIQGNKFPQIDKLLAEVDNSIKF
ncbi:TIGR04197 family type VII secretion effector [Bombilactobacillus thymidiniphilus]|uniref:TIGR04197 family type VII secretion effector n=1 Tax=Bombilactobacillus thymidiniphilus TaxID=2923363 RepID=A0ABY4PBY8_9LACO|nr:TIGR04197 family type VII secretion effector [Bombilactobacillus thymidiniphilus]UQS83056.1 TIGR04197 family type VII secretion effector [Bombilactobacillus thymidiniphilus]